MDCLEQMKFFGHFLVGLSEIALVIVTGYLAYFTFRLVKETQQMARDARESVKTQICVSAWLEFVKRFDSQEMINARIQLAAARWSYPDNPITYGQRSEIVLNFFENLAIIYNKGFIDTELSDSSFGYYVRRWWKATEPYILSARKTDKAKNTLYDQFESLVLKLEKDKTPLGKNDIDIFLQDERSLSK
jgi:Domain of unknown function (DUF4760)